VNDVWALQAVLVERYGFEKNNITVLLNAQATRQAIMDTFTQLVAKAADTPALFYFAGNGSNTPADTPTIVSADGREPGIYDIDLAELAALVKDKNTQLTTIMDAGWTRSDERSVSSRNIPPDQRSVVATRDLGFIRHQPLDPASLRVGHVAIYGGSLNDEIVYFEHEAEFPEGPDNNKRAYHGVLTHALLEILQTADPSTLTYAQLEKALAGARQSPLFIGDNLDTAVFSYIMTPASVQKAFAHADRASVEDTVESLKNVIGRLHDQFPEGYLNLGIAQALLGRYSDSIHALETALQQQPDYPEAHYHLGRVLFESMTDLGQALSELRQATTEDPDNAAAYYYLGQTIREIVQRETLAEAERALRAYVERGAPLGHEATVQAFLQERQQPVGQEQPPTR
jgi:tetratricopeptide (TPR) repeat protein